METIATVTFNPVVDKGTSVVQVVAERKLRCTPPRFDPGGGGVNVSRAVRKLGGWTRAVYLAGGYTGILLGELLDAEGIDRHPVAISDWTRENLIVHEDSTGRQYRFGMPGPTVTSQEIEALLAEVAALSPAPRYVVASGSLPLAAPPEVFGIVAEVARGLGARLLVDTSGPALLAAARAHPYLIKCNLAELSTLAGEPVADETHLDRIARMLLADKAAEVLVVSLGPGGALLESRDEHVRFLAPTVPIQSRVGAGDSMVGGLVLSLARGLPLEAAVRFGVAAGSAAVMTPASELCRREDTERLFARVPSPEPLAGRALRDD